MENNTKKPNDIKKLPEPVYYIESPNDNSVLIGIDITIEPANTAKGKTFLIEWYDTIHERHMIASEITQQENNFSFKRAEHEGGGIYHFTPMTLEIYNNNVKHHLISKPKFTSKEDMIKSLLLTLENQ